MKLQKKNSRSGVSAEAYGQHNKKQDFKPKIITKTEDQKKRIRSRLQQTFMFQNLEENE